MKDDEGPDSNSREPEREDGAYNNRTLLFYHNVNDHHSLSNGLTKHSAMSQLHPF